MIPYTDIVVIILGFLAILLCLKMVLFGSCKCGHSTGGNVIYPQASVALQQQMKQEMGERIMNAVSERYPTKAFSACHKSGAVDTSSEDSSPRIQDDDAPMCSICLDKFHANDRVIQFDCRHIFHSACIRPWFMMQRVAICPLCKRNVLRLSNLSGRLDHVFGSDGSNNGGNADAFIVHVEAIVRGGGEDDGNHNQDQGNTNVVREVDTAEVGALVREDAVVVVEDGIEEIAI